MEKLKQILTGVSDYGEIRRGNGYFVDRIDLIAELDKTRFALFLRPRRFSSTDMPPTAISRSSGAWVPEFP